jgi:hypothetical protein
VFVAFRLQKYLLEKRAVVDVDNGKLLNEDSDIRLVSSNPIDALIYTFILHENLVWMLCSEENYFK